MESFKNTTHTAIAATTRTNGAAEARVWQQHHRTSATEESNGSTIEPFSPANAALLATLSDATQAKPVLQRLPIVFDAAHSVAEFQRLCEAACDAQSQPAWNWCVRLGSALSVATALGAVYVRCGRLTLARAASS